MKNKKMSSRSVGMRDINAAFSAPISRIKALRDDEGRRGFTLIELLVVVLIIGVLAAIAVPQYQKAVLKSRFSSLMPTAKAIRDGNEMYYMTNGRYADAVSKLDVTATNNADMTLTVSDDPDYAYTMATRPSLKNNLIMYQKHSVNFPGEIHCEALTGNTQAEWLCETGMHAVKSVGSIINNDYTTYVLEGSGNGLPSWTKNMHCDAATALGFICEPGKNSKGEGYKKLCKDGICIFTVYHTDGTYSRLSCNEEGQNCESMLYTYDDEDRILSYRGCSSWEEIGVCNSWYSQSGYDYTYDEYGTETHRRCAFVYEDGHCDYYNGETKRYYDDKGRIIATKNPSYRNPEGGTYYQYDENGGRTAWICSKIAADGSCSGTLTPNTVLTYDQYGNPLTSRSNVKQPAAFSYTYDDEGNVLTSSYRVCSSLSDEGVCTPMLNSNDHYDMVYNPDGTAQIRKGCNRVNESGECTNYTYIEEYVYDESGRAFAYNHCHSSNINQNTGTCTTTTTSALVDQTSPSGGYWW